MCFVRWNTESTSLSTLLNSVSILYNVIRNRLTRLRRQRTSHSQLHRKDSISIPMTNSITTTIKRSHIIRCRNRRCWSTGTRKLGLLRHHLLLLRLLGLLMACERLSMLLLLLLLGLWRRGRHIGLLGASWGWEVLLTRWSAVLLLLRWWRVGLVLLGAWGVGCGRWRIELVSCAWRRSILLLGLICGMRIRQCSFDQGGLWELGGMMRVVQSTRKGAFYIPGVGYCCFSGGAVSISQRSCSTCPSLARKAQLLELESGHLRG